MTLVRFNIALIAAFVALPLSTFAEDVKPASCGDKDPACKEAKPQLLGASQPGHAEVKTVSADGAVAALSEGQTVVLPTKNTSDTKALPSKYYFAYSPRGPGEGNTIYSSGGRLLLVVPFFDQSLIYGITDSLDLELRSSNLVILGLVDGGLRYRLVGETGFSLGVRANLTAGYVAIGIGDIGGAALMLAATPGVIMSFGGDSMQFTIGVDVPMFFYAGAGIEDESRSKTGFVPTVRPSLAFEFMSGGKTSCYYIQASLYTYSGLPLLPTLGVGWTY